ncbi:hypothetical protein [Cupriavidus sp. USMAA2-4]|uniref:hypothetical protein n=1 Tax=Cupriavidus sp. USMAA2-4 TaxID=876364 RepID=UPI0012F510F0|nr:hypothetical protein [Cupriavidus sp. USMAA2-4]
MSMQLDRGRFPSLRQLLTAQDKTVHEPSVPKLIKASAFFVNTVGMREAPERLITELFRELFFGGRPANAPAGARELQPCPEDTLEESALLHLERGRAKRITQRGNASLYYAPLYPVLARNSWPRKGADRVIQLQLIEGLLAQHVRDCGGKVAEWEPQAISETIIDALQGKPRGDGCRDILSEVASRIDPQSGSSRLMTSEEAVLSLSDTLKNQERQVLDCRDRDPLASRLGEDFYHLCELEGKIPRILWIEHLKVYLRLGISAWLLGNMRLTVALRDWSLEAFGGNVANEDTVSSVIAGRWRGLFHPTQTGSNEIALHIERYIKARVELSLLVYTVRNTCGYFFDTKKLAVHRSDSSHLSVTDWLAHCRVAGERLQFTGANAENLRAELVPLAQQFGAWLQPTTRGQGKNIDEFLRILLRLHTSDNDDGYLLTSLKGGLQRVSVFPGSGMIRTVLQLAAAAKGRKNGKIVLADLERQFSAYGVEFSASIGARPKLVFELARLGLLKGSPDAGDSAELLP